MVDLRSIVGLPGSIWLIATALKKLFAENGFLYVIHHRAKAGRR
jgi:hypothetical protein